MLKTNRVLVVLLLSVLFSCSEHDHVHKEDHDSKSVTEDVVSEFAEFGIESESNEIEVKQYQVVPVTNPQARLYKIADVFGLQHNGEIENQETALSLTGLCDETPCEITLHHQGGFVDFRRYPIETDNQSSVSEEKSSSEELITFSNKLLSNILPNWQDQQGNTSIKVDTDGVLSKVIYQRFLQVTEGIGAPILGQTTMINFDGKVVDSAWISLLETEVIGTEKINLEYSFDAFLAPRDMVLDEYFNSFIAFNGPSSELSPKILPLGLVVFTQHKDLIGKQHHEHGTADHDHGSAVTDSHHSRRTFFMPICNREGCEKNCGEEGSGICFGPGETEPKRTSGTQRTIPREPKTKFDATSPKKIAKPDPKPEKEIPPKPAPEEPPEIFGEPINASALCTKPAAPNSKGFSIAGWSGQASTTQDQGLGLDKVQYQGNQFAKQLRSALAYKVTTSRGIFQCHLEAKGDKSKDCHSTLVKPGLVVKHEYFSVAAVNFVSIKALYCVEGFPATIDNKAKPECRPKLLVGQRYLMNAARSGATAFFDLSDSAQWNPTVDYAWVKPAKNCPKVSLDEFNLWSLLDHDLNEDNQDIAAFYKDTDDTMAQQSVLPSEKKSSSYIMANYGSPGTHDNYHQKDYVATTARGELNSFDVEGAVYRFLGIDVLLVLDRSSLRNVLKLKPTASPITIPGCSGAVNGRFACAHFHWRWGTTAAKALPNQLVPQGGIPGKVLTPDYQKVEAGVSLVNTNSKTKPNQQATPFPFFVKKAESFDTSHGSDLKLLLSVTSKRDKGRIHAQEQLFFR